MNARVHRWALLLGLAATSAGAQLLDAETPPPERSPLAGLYVRAGLLHLHPQPSSGEVQLSGVEGPARLAIADGPVAGSGAGVEPVTLPALTVGYRFWGPLAVETILAVPFTIHLKARGTLATESLSPTALGNLPTGVPPLGEELGEATAAPPTVTVTWRFLPDRWYQPYVGAGATLLLTYGARITNAVLTEVSPPTLTISPAVGWVVQAGIDLHLWRQLFVSLDGKYIGGLEVEAKMTDLHVRTPGLPLYDPVDVGTATLRVAINPWLVTGSVGWSF